MEGSHMVDKQPHGREESFRGRVKPQVLGKHAWNGEKDCTPS